MERNLEQDKDYNKEYDLVQVATAAVTIGGAAVGTMGKGLSLLNQGRCERIVRNAQEKYRNAFDSLQKNSQAAQDMIQKVVLAKKEAMGPNMKTFLKAYRRLNPRLFFNQSAGLNELECFVPQRPEFREIKLTARVYERYSEVSLGERAGDAAFMMVQDGTVENIFRHTGRIYQARRAGNEELERSAKDDLKLQMIPVLAHFSTVSVKFALDGMSNMLCSFKQVGEAKKAAAELAEQTEKLRLSDIGVQAIERYAGVHLTLLSHYEPLLDRYIPKAVEIIRSKDTFWPFGRIKAERFTQEEMELLAFTFSLVGAVKVIVDSPIIARDGQVYTQEDEKFRQACGAVEKFESLGRRLSS